MLGRCFDLSRIKMIRESVTDRIETVTDRIFTLLNMVKHADFSQIF